MEERKLIPAGRSDARIRQGGGTVPAPPRSGECREPCDGLPESLTASGSGAWAIVEDRLEQPIEEELPPQRLRGGGDPEKEDEVFSTFDDDNLTQEDRAYIEKFKQLQTHEGSTLYNYIEDTMVRILHPMSTFRVKKHHGFILANVVREVADKLSGRVEETTKLFHDIRDKHNKLHKQYEELRRKMEGIEKESENSRKGMKMKWTQTAEEISKIDKKEKWIQVKLEPLKKDIGVQTRPEDGTTTMEVDVNMEDIGVYNQAPRIEERLDEILRRIDDLEKKKDPREKDETLVPWTKVLGRNKKKTIQDSPPINLEGGTLQKEMEEKEKRGRPEVVKKKDAPLRTLKKKVLRGAGVLIEVKRGTQKDYEEIINRCQKEISLMELGIPPIGIRKTRNGGILLEIKSEEEEEEKADILANKIKEMVEPMEGVQVRRPTRRLRLRLTGLPFGVAATDIATAVAEIGEGLAGLVRVGPIRTSASGAGVVWADCPAKMALRAAGAAGLTLGWARVGVSLEKGGHPQSPLPCARAPRTIMPLGGWPGALLSEVRRGGAHDRAVRQ